MKTYFDYLKDGGLWIKTVRQWIQVKYQNGERVTWGSYDELRPCPTVADMEEIGAKVACAVEEELKAKLRNLIADYMRSEGCSCCQNTEMHDDIHRKLGELLDVPLYDDGSGHNFYQFCTDPL